MVSVQLPCGNAWVSEYGAPPVIGSAPSHASDHETSFGYEPALTTISDETGWPCAGAPPHKGVSIA